MRVSTAQIFDSGTSNIQRNQSSLFKLQNQLSTGRRILAPEDDPIGASEALKVNQSMSVNAQLMENQANAASQLALVEDHLGSVSDLILDVQSRVAEAGNGSLTGKDRQAIATEIRQRYDELVGLANSADGTGQYLFAGYRGSTQPFGTTGIPGSQTATYYGDDGVRQLQVGNDRQMATSQPGSDIFMRIRQGNGTFMTGAGGANTGSGVISTGSMVTGYDNNQYTLVFGSAATQATPAKYLLQVNGLPSFQPDPNGNPILDPAGTNNFLDSSGNPTIPAYDYTDNATINIGNGTITTPNTGTNQIAFSISGTPAPGDTFTIDPSTNRDLFATLDQMIKTLETPTIGATPGATQAIRRNQLIGIGDSLDRALDNVLRMRTDIGARRLELDSLTNVGEDVNLQYKADLSRLQDLDYNKAISDMSQQKMVLEAAQLSFKQTSQLSLFSLL